MRFIFVSFLRLYRAVISPMLPVACRFEPTCSVYAREAIETHGAFKGGFLAVKRLARCHPLGSHGFDPVPHACGPACGHGAAHE